MDYVLTDDNWLYDKNSYKQRNIPFSLRESTFCPIQLSDANAEVVRGLIDNNIHFEVCQWIKH